MQPARPQKRVGEAEGMNERLGEGQRLLALLEGLVWIAERPQNEGGKGEARHPAIKRSVEEGEGVMLLPIIQGARLFEVRAGRHEVSQLVQRNPKRIVGLEEESWVLPALGKGEQ